MIIRFVIKRESFQMGDLLAIMGYRELRPALGTGLVLKASQRPTDIMGSTSRIISLYHAFVLLAATNR